MNQTRILAFIEDYELSLLERIEQLERELTAAEKKYSDLLVSSIQHSESMMASLVVAMIKPKDEA